MAMTTIKSFEDAVIARLASVVTGVSVVASPQDPNGWQSLLATTTKSMLVVGYRGGSFTDFVEQGPAGQDRTMGIEVTVLTRNLRDHTGAYPLVDAVISGLTGYEAVSGATMRIVGDGFAGVTDGLWIFVVRAQCVIPEP